MSILDLFDKANAALFNHAKVNGDYTLVTDALNVELTSIVESNDSGKITNHDFIIELDSGNSIEFKFAFWELTPKSYVFNVMDWRLNIDGMGYNAYFNKFRTITDLDNRELELEIIGKMGLLVSRLQTIV